MNLITTLLSTFFYNYIIILILNLLKVKNKRKVAIIIISIFNIGEAVTLLINMINVNATHDFYYWYYFLTQIGGVLIAYFITLTILLRGTHFHIKTRRQREFDREYYESKRIYAILFDVTMVLLSILMVLLLIITILYRSHIKNYILYIIGISIFSIIFIFLSIYSLSIDFKIRDKKIKGLTLFIIKDGDTYHNYLYDGKNGKIENQLGKICEIYTLNKYGIIKKNNNTYNVIGIAPSNFNKELYNEIKLDSFDNSLDNVYNEFDKYSYKRIIIDENNNIVNVKKLK